MSKLAQSTSELARRASGLVRRVSELTPSRSELVRHAGELARRMSELVRDISKPAHGSEQLTDAELLAFQPDIVEIERRAAPRAAQITLFAVVGLITVAVVWASLAQIDRIVIAEGRLVTTSSKIVVQPLETGVVRSIHVRVGQSVRKGDVLAMLDATFTEADTAASRAALVSFDAQLVRLESLKAGERPEEFSPDPRENALQADMFNRHGSELGANLAALDGEIGALSAELETNKNEIADAEKTLAIARQLENMRVQLVERSAGSLLQSLESQARRASAERDVNRLVNTARQIEQKLAGAREKRIAYLSENQSKVMQELQNIRRDRGKVSEELKKQERRSSLVQLTAPVDAVVLEIAQRSVGSIASQAEPLVTMVPLDAPLEAEVDIQPQDVAMLRGNDSARIKLDALPYQQHGTLDGRLDVVSADVIKSDKGPSGQQIPIYRARVAITRRDLRNVPDDFRLIPGMAASAEIKIGQRRLISYFVYPIFRALDESFREP